MSSRSDVRSLSSQLVKSDGSDLVVLWHEGGPIGPELGERATPVVQPAEATHSEV